MDAGWMLLSHFTALSMTNLLKLYEKVPMYGEPYRRTLHTLVNWLPRNCGGEVRRQASIGLYITFDDKYREIV